MIESARKLVVGLSSCSAAFHDVLFFATISSVTDAGTVRVSLFFFFCWERGHGGVMRVRGLVLSAVTVSKKKMQEENKGNSAAFRPLMPERQNVMDESRDSCEDRKAAKADFIRV